jgi:two-component system, chemotaxis family, CheB/CheR fusion protein
MEQSSSSPSSDGQPSDEMTDPPTDQRFPVIGIGASAGGIEAVRVFFDSMPIDSGMAFVIILHLPADYDSEAASLIQAHTSMLVQEVTERVPIKPNHVYMIPPGKHLAMVDGHIQLEEPATEEDRRAPVDHFLRTLADTHHRFALAIILSGTGSDGAIGLKRIKDPQEAKWSGMPRSAIATGLADYVLPIAAMPDMLSAYWRRLENVAMDGNTTDVQETNLREILALLRVRTNHDFSQYKRPTVLRRIGRRMQVTGVSDFETYMEVLRTRPDEVQALLQDLLISVTNFFRDREAWTTLESIMPLIFAGKGPGDQVRVWIPACATGEEAYSVAMLLQEYAATLDYTPLIQIFATDIDDTSIAQARRASYPKTIEGDVSPDRLRRFFTFEQGRYRVKQELRELVLFAHHNVLRDPPFSQLDLITCRNLLIYLNREAQEQVIRLFSFSLRRGGYVLLGNAESMEGVSQLFDVVVKGQRLFRQRANIPLVPPPKPVRGRTLLPELPSSTPVQDTAPKSIEAIHQQLILAHAPPSVIVNEEYEIVHISPGVGRFLQFEAGTPSTNLIRAAYPALRLEVRSALLRATHERTRAESQRVRVTIDNVVRLVNLVVEPILQPGWPGGYFFVRFNDIGETDDAEASASIPQDKVVKELEADLARTREQLQLTVEAYETAGEEYKAANEELTAINEELRAATEELETSKEELQAVNEELTTVNHELKFKVDEIIQANNDLQNLIAATQIGTIFLDRDLRIMRYTPSVESIFNLLPTDLHRPLSHVTHTLKYTTLEADARTVLASLMSSSMEVESTSGKWYLAQLRPYRTSDDRIGGVVITFIDLTERKQAEAERERLLREAEAALEVRNQFLSIASHELRTPLTPLLGYTNILRQNIAQSSDEAQLRMMDAIDRQAKRLNTLIGTLLDVARLQRGQFALDVVPLDIGELTERVVDEFRMALPETGIEPVISYNQPDEVMTVSGDASRLEEVLHNLLSNAAKYSPNGGEITVEVSRRNQDIVLTVTDHGLGIAPEVQARLFEPFYRGPNIGSRVSGFGLGLYIVEQLVRRHDGHIEVESAEGQGTTMRVVLPALL